MGALRVGGSRLSRRDRPGVKGVGLAVAVVLAVSACAQPSAETQMRTSGSRFHIRRETASS
jgi:hypothetical protein